MDAAGLSSRIGGREGEGRRAVSARFDEFAITDDRFEPRATSWVRGHLRATSVQVIDLFRCQFGFGCTQSVVEVRSAFRTDDGEDRKRL